MTGTGVSDMGGVVSPPGEGEDGGGGGRAVDKKSTAWSMTTYGVLGALGSLAVRDDISAWSFGAARGVKYAVYEDGIDMP